MGGVDGIGCQHFQVVTAQLLLKDREWQEDRWKDNWQGSERTRPTMFLTDIKTAFDVVKTGTYIASGVGVKGAHGWMTAFSSKTRHGEFGRTGDFRKR